MSNLILNSLEIRNFRGLKELKIEKLGRVNLLVGKNNVGKTSVLEALNLFANPASMEVLLDLLGTRDQLDTEALTRDKPKRIRYRFDDLFYVSGNTETETHRSGVIQIGPAGHGDNTVAVSLELKTKKKDPHDVFGPRLHFNFEQLDAAVPVFALDTFEAEQFERRSVRAGLTTIRSLPTVYLGPGGLEPSRIEALWDKIALTASEDAVMFALRLISGRIQRLTLRPIGEGSPNRVPFVKLTDRREPVTLRSMGDGTVRIFGLALAIAHSKDGFLLIDEFENGIHYSVMFSVWRFLFNMAKARNTQVFVTTHSYDCIRAFEEAAKESPEEGVLIGLAQKRGRLLVGEYNEEDLEVVVEGGIEVRG